MPVYAANQIDFLDGGGIRGLWSLLALERLMENIADQEEQQNEKALHSFSPETWPGDLTQEPATDEEKRRYEVETDPERKLAATAKASRYLPCHYFDYIGGSSTGG